MIPDTITVPDEITEAEDFESASSLTYRLDFANHRIIGTVDEQEAVVQFIRKVLDTDKYAYEIYDWYYGNELMELIGMSYDYIVVEAPRIIQEALLVDDRILALGAWKFEQLSPESMSISFMVYTIYGNLEYTAEVQS